MLDVSISKKYYHRPDAPPQLTIQNLKFNLERGLVGAIIGPSGCGKTTLLKLIAGLDTAFEGKIFRPDLGLISMVFQEPRLLPWRTVDANIRIAAPKATESELTELLAAFSLNDHRQHFPGELSLGLARRVALVRALAVRPNLLLLDEPSASLDGAMAERLLQELTDLVENRPVTALLVTHDVETAIRLADRIFVLSPQPSTLVTTINIAQPRRQLDAAMIQRLTREIAEAQAALPQAIKLAPESHR